MKDCNPKNNRTVSNKSALQANIRKGRKIPKEVFKSESQASTGTNRWTTPLITSAYQNNNVFAHQHVLSESLLAAIRAEVNALTGGITSTTNLQYIPDSNRITNVNEIPF